MKQPKPQYQQIQTGELCFFQASDKPETWVCGVVVSLNPDHTVTVSFGDMYRNISTAASIDEARHHTHFFVQHADALKPCGQLIDKSFSSREQAISGINKILGIS